MDLRHLLEPVSDGAPSGHNLEYEMIFSDMEIAAQSEGQREIGDISKVAKIPDFKKLSEKAAAVLRQSHDIRAAVFLVEAELVQNGLSGFAGALEVVLGYLRDEWNTCHPELDEEDGDATMRINAVRGLADFDRILRRLRSVNLTDSSVFGPVSIRTINISEGRIQPSDDAQILEFDAISASFNNSSENFIAKSLKDVIAARKAVLEISDIFSERTPGQGPALEDLASILSEIEMTYRRFTPKILGKDADPIDAERETDVVVPDTSSEGKAAPIPSPATVERAIRGPNDVLRALDDIVTYYRLEEPSSPVPVLLARAKKLVNADFLTIIGDMASDSLDDIRKLGGIPEPGEDD